MQLFNDAWRRYQIRWRFFFGLLLGVAIALNPYAISFGNDRSETLESQLPIAAQHPLPATLQQLGFDGLSEQRDYFDEIEVSPLGYLIWSEFPVTIFYPQIEAQLSPNQQRQRQQWQQAVEQAIADWSLYLPLAMTADPETADIVFLREAPPIQTTVDPDTGERHYSFGRNAETRYQFYLDAQRRLSHKMTIYLSAHQRAIATLTTARHELGHALGIWGHSNNSNDALYVQQIHGNPGISAADINTLKKIYQQPTQLGWQLP